MKKLIRCKRGLSFMISWLKLRQEQHTLAEFFSVNGYRSVAIYGVKEIGLLLLSELRQEGGVTCGMRLTGMQIKSVRTSLL